MADSRRPRRRLVAALLIPGAVLGTAGITALPAMAAPPGDLASQTVTSGDARFQVLSPTLIRTEYADDGVFTDDSTFNVVGRGDFAPVDYDTSVADGWLTIDTGQMSIRYREGSGDFTPQNISVSLTADSGQVVTGSPWQSVAVAACDTGVLCEAEDLTLNGLALATNHSGATGPGFAAGFEATGNSVSFDTTVAASGAYDLALRYANSQGGDGQVTTRTLTVTVDGGSAQTIQLAPTANWDTWALTSTALALTPGQHRVVIQRTAADSGQINLDSLALVTAGTAYPAPSTEAVVADCAFGTLCEAETGALAGGATAAGDHNGASGEAFLAGLGQGASVTTHVTDVPADGQYALQVRYANGGAMDRGISVQAAGDAVAATLPVTSGWDYWRTVSVPVNLTAGENDVTVACPDTDSCQLNIDTVALASSDAPLLAPHAALGGYRRDLDQVNGSPITNPGLLYQDGWSLVDDTASSLYDPATQAVTPRGDHGGLPYHDGYVFGYGDDYDTGLKDLAQLTGPTMLLPQWAYGVWYSEYYDRTSSEFTDQIVPKFRSEGVPVDVMAIDTDFKSPDKWNGWEVDTSRFPDMSGLLAELESEGIHNTLNIHPTIQSTDPKFAAAQATSNNALTPSTDTDKFLFDWSDPAQLKAYFDLHGEFQADGTDIYWLDWCCNEQSKYSANGVTPDAFINNQYADYTADALNGRGFAFSRAYGSLTAGGYGNPQAVPTGPWADKRTTLHFTGDTRSTWQMLQGQVGYTPGESAATGLAAISHDIGGHFGGDQKPGMEPGSTQLPGDLYARWVQFGAFQPIDRLHSNHSDRLPWQYDAVTDASATSFLNLRENLVPLTYSLAAEATATGAPIVRPLYLAYPGDQEAYAMAGREYLYGSDVLVAPVTSPGETATTTVWFPSGSDWTDYFTGETHPGGTTADVTTDLNRMPVFVKSGGIVPTRTNNVTNDSQNPLTDVTLTVTGGADGTFDLYEDNGAAGAALQSATTAIGYTEQEAGGTLTVAPADGSFDGQVTDRAWTTTFRDVDEPRTVTVDGTAVAAGSWSYDAASRTLSVPVASRSVSTPTTVSFSSADAGVTPPETTPTPTPSPTDAAPSPTPGSGSDSAGGSGSTSSQGGDLASTGSAAALIAGVGAVLLALGGLLLWRRRRAA
ncbi:TIM-barrel domain-containing protein [Herbiconiux solani]|uniref:TIM-barrel domain-containing protein n=1 Tax=Herbiconiux solani TaxID=661329 RepID=UPI000A05017E|nr:TIM-barrel domain-containing protein [Herbiconiux solani]